MPDHAVQGTPDAELHPRLNIPGAQLIIRKGYRKHVDSYSAFLEADRTTPTGLAGYLRERGLRHVYLVGLATDFCVAWSALDARKMGFAATVVEDATRGIDTGGSLAKAWKDMEEARAARSLVGHRCVRQLINRVPQAQSSKPPIPPMAGRRVGPMTLPGAAE
jgi:nicotinamidase/pyrazinamidase